MDAVVSTESLRAPSPPSPNLWALWALFFTLIRQDGTSGDAVQGELDGHAENNSVAPPSAAEAAATEEGSAAADQPDSSDVGRQEEHQDSDGDLYDIDDQGLSSSDDD